MSRPSHEGTAAAVVAVVKTRRSLHHLPEGAARGGEEAGEAGEAGVDAEGAEGAEGPQKLEEAEAEQASGNSYPQRSAWP